MNFAAPQEPFQILSKVPGYPRELRLDFAGHFDRELQSIASQDDNSVSLTPTTPGWPLRALTLNTTELCQDVFSWLLSKAVNLSQLQKLTLVRYYAGVTDAFVAPGVLRAIGSSLRKLKLACRFDEFPNSLLETLISGCYHYGESSLGIRGGLSICIEMIRTLQRHESLQEIVLVVDIRLLAEDFSKGADTFTKRSVTAPTDPLPDWELLDTRLANHSYFPNFNCLHFVAEITRSALNRPNNPWTSATPLCRDLETRVHSVLPQLNAKGAVI
ncbi:hypothetical protein PQX77_003611 [Marasmius sp. AFHP31]|nr:hypothetical protein PQX77_003611 [Marasmius sp. AFHP31]